MSDIFWLLMLFPLVWPFIAKKWFDAEFTWAEMSINIVLVCLLAGGIWQMGKYSNMSDTEVWSGQVTNKKVNDGAYVRSYQCNCYSSCSGTGSKRTCTQVCQTCYEDRYTRSYDGYSNVGNWTFDSIDTTSRSRRNRFPPTAAYTNCKVGEPASREHSYTNYVRANAESLFHEGAALAEKYKDQIPAYPRVHDYYRIDRVQAIGVDIPDLKQWNENLSIIMQDLGPKKQANVNLIFVNNPDPMYMKALKSAWQGFKKNDIVITVGVTQYPKIDWVDVDSWSKADMINVALRDDLLALNHIRQDAVLNLISDNVQDHYIRRPMAEFEYLEDEIEPPMWAMIMALIVMFVGSPALTWYMNRPGVDIRFPFER